MMRPQRRWSPSKATNGTAGGSSTDLLTVGAACDDSPTSTIVASSSFTNVNLSHNHNNGSPVMKQRRRKQDSRIYSFRRISFLASRFKLLLTMAVRLGAACLLLSYLRPLLHYSQEQRATANVSSSVLTSDGDEEGNGNGDGIFSTEQHDQFLQYSSNLPTCNAISPEQVSYTLVTQCSEDRLWMMEHHCKRWSVTAASTTHDSPSPISLVVYTNMTIDDAKRKLSDRYHCPVDAGLTVQVLPMVYKDADYPVNILRNMAFAAVATTHAAYVDIDFWTSTDLHDILMTPVVQHKLAQSHQHALVLPAFQLHRQCHAWQACPRKTIPLMPKTKNDMIPFLLNKTITAFDPTNFGGHGSTRYVEWVDQAADELLPIECVKSNRYEPYLVVRVCNELPPLQPSLFGYGKNKMTWIMQLRRVGYTFDQLGEAFVTHYPHMDSKARLIWNGGPRGAHLQKPADENSFQTYQRGRTDQTFVKFRSWLETLPDRTKVFRCEEHLDDDARLWVAHSDKQKVKEMNIRKVAIADRTRDESDGSEDDESSSDSADAAES
ncbi:hypothetical protein MPSEU_000942600 [Mayamaea pseudoterrestris]|nr:hypothetical protein MPSEU_000942600 [Mayamaea pseudoterrestris]